MRANLVETNGEFVNEETKVMAQGDYEGMNDSQVDIRQIEMFADCYHIPSYQRGYRWTKDNATALLNDLREFRTTREADGTRQRCYCLQPIVFQRLKDGSMIVVDGQQRLTTIAIIRYVLEGERINFGWNLYYDELSTDLHQLLANLDADTSINGHFMREVRDAVREWRSDPMNAPANARLKEDVFDLFRPDETKVQYEQSVFFIPYIQDQSDAKDDGQTTFNQLNDGQTPLTSSELIKALFLVSDNGLSAIERQNIAKEWSEIEAALRQDDLWLIWRTDDFADCYTRLDVLFAAIVDVDSKAYAGDRLAVYHAVEKWLGNHSEDGKEAALKLLWEKVLRCYWWMLSCKEDAEAYNLLGWISGRTDNQFKTIYEKVFPKKGYLSFKVSKRVLRDMIRKSFSDWQINLKDISGMRYGMEHLDDLLMLANVLDASRMGGKLPFEVINGKRRYLSDVGYKNWSWNIEHISPQTPTNMESEEKKLWVEFAENELGEHKDGTIDERFACLWERYVVEQLKDVDSIANLVLLDSATNQSYGNHLFAVKRKKILEVNDEFNKNGRVGRPVLPLTYKAFSKAFYGHADQMRFWSEMDAAAYFANMQKLFSEFDVKEV